MAIVLAVILRAWNQFAYGVLAAGSGSGGSGWQASNSNSFEVIADYGDGVDADGFGIARHGVTLSSAANGILLTATNSVALSWLPAERRPKRYFIAYQAAATFNPANTSTIIAEVDGDTCEVTIASPTGIASLAAHDQAPTVSVNPAWFTIQERQLNDIAAGGELVAVSRVHAPMLLPDGNDSSVSPFDSIVINTAAMGSSMAIWPTLLKWRDMQLPVVLEDYNTDIDSRYRYYYGRLNSIPYAGSNAHHQSDGGRNSIALRVEGVGLA